MAIACSCKTLILNDGKAAISPILHMAISKYCRMMLWRWIGGSIELLGDIMVLSYGDIARLEYGLALQPAPDFCDFCPGFAGWLPLLNG